MSRISDRLQHCLLGLLSRDSPVAVQPFHSWSVFTLDCILRYRSLSNTNHDIFSKSNWLGANVALWGPRGQQLIKVIKNNSAKQEKLYCFNKGEKHKGPRYKTLHCHMEIPLSQLNLASHSLSKRMLYIHYYRLGSKIFISCRMLLCTFGSLFPGNIFFPHLKPLSSL